MVAVSGRSSSVPHQTNGHTTRGARPRHSRQPCGNEAQTQAATCPSLSLGSRPGTPRCGLLSGGAEAASPTHSCRVEVPRGQHRGVWWGQGFCWER